MLPCLSKSYRIWGARAHLVSRHRSCFGPCRRWRHVHSKAAGEDIYSARIQTYEEEQRWQDILLLYDSMRTDGFPVGAAVFQTVMRACQEQEQWHKALEVYTAMQAAGYRPGSSAYDILETICVQEPGLWSDFQQQQLVLEREVPMQPFPLYETSSDRWYAPHTPGTPADAHVSQTPGPDRSVGADDKAARDSGPAHGSSPKFPEAGHEGDLPGALAVVSALAEDGLWDEAIAQWTGQGSQNGVAVRGNDGAPTGPVLQVIDGAAGKRLVLISAKQKDWDRGLQVYGLMKAHGIALDQDTFSVLICCCAQSGKASEAWGLYADMQELMLTPDANACRLLLQLDIPAVHHQRAQEVLERVISVSEWDAALYVLAIACCARMELWDRVLRYSSQMRAAGHRPSLQTYNCMLQAYRGTKKWDAARETFAEMLHKPPVPPDSQTYSLMINVFVRGGETLHHKALNLFQTAQRRKWVLDKLAYHDVIVASRRLGPTTHAVAAQALVAMRTRGMAPSQETYSELLMMYWDRGKLGDWDGVWDGVWTLYTEMQALGLQPTAHDYDVMVHAAKRTGHLQEALQVWDAMQSHGVRIQGVYNPILSVCRQLQRWDLVVQIWREMRTFGNRLNKTMYMFVIEGCVMVRDVDAAEEAWESMVSAGFPPERKYYRTFCALLRLLHDHRRWDSIKKVYGAMQSHGLSLPSRMYNIIIQACSESLGPQEAVQMCVQVFEEMQKHQLLPDMQVCYRLFKSCRVARDWQRADALYRQLRTLRINFDAQVYEQLLGALWGSQSSPQMKLCWDIFLEASNRGCAPRATTARDGVQLDLQSTGCYTSQMAVLHWALTVGLPIAQSGGSASLHVRSANSASARAVRAFASTLGLQARPKNVQDESEAIALEIVLSGKVANTSDGPLQRLPGLLQIVGL